MGEIADWLIEQMEDKLCYEFYDYEFYDDDEPVTFNYRGDNMITTTVRFSFVNVFEPAETPSGDLKYSAAIMIDENDTKGLSDINVAIQQAIKKGVEKNTFPKSAVKNLRLPLRNGTEEFKAGDRGKEFDGYMFMNASSKNRPGVVGKDLKPIMDTDEFYSGVWGRADVNFYPYNAAGNRGIGVGLNNLMKERNDDRLDGRQKAEDAFSDFADTEAKTNIEKAEDMM